MQRVIGKRVVDTGRLTLLSQQSLRFFAPSGSVGTLSRAQVPKERFMNRSEWMANKFKNDPMAYTWVPEVMTTIDPAP